MTFEEWCKPREPIYGTTEDRFIWESAQNEAFKEAAEIAQQEADTWTASDMSHVREACLDIKRAIEALK